MKPSIYRRIRRRTTTEAATNKKEIKQEQSFFGGPATETFFQPAAIIQRKCEKCKEDDKKVQRSEDKKEEDKLQRQPEKKEEEKLMKKEEEKKDESIMKKGGEEEKKVQKKEAGGNSSSITSSYISSLNGKGTSLPKSAQQFFGGKMGYDFSNVKVHTDNEAAQSAREVNAKAYTVGNNIVFNEGRYDTESTEGKKLMAHELVHVVQNHEVTTGKIKRQVEEAEPQQEEGV